MKPLIEAMKCHPFSWNLWLLTQNSPEYREKVNETIGKKQFLTVNYFFAKRQRIESQKISLFSWAISYLEMLVFLTPRSLELKTNVGPYQFLTRAILLDLTFLTFNIFINQWSFHVLSPFIRKFLSFYTKPDKTFSK